MPVPKYQEIIDVLNDELSRGKLHQGDKFYSESDICSRFNVSSTTAVKVLNVLQQQNKVTRIKGKGTFVAKENHKSVVFLTDLNMSNGKSEDVKVLSVEKQNDPHVLAKLELKPTEEYIKITRLRYIGDDISQFTVNNIRPEYINNEKIANLSNFDSVYNRIKEDSGIDPYRLPFSQKTTVQELNNSEILKYFDSSKTSFIHQERLTYLPNIDKPILEYAYTYKDPQFWGFKTDSVFGSSI